MCEKCKFSALPERYFFIYAHFMFFFSFSTIDRLLRSPFSCFLLLSLYSPFFWIVRIGQKKKTNDTKCIQIHVKRTKKSKCDCCAKLNKKNRWLMILWRVTRSLSTICARACAKKIKLKRINRCEFVIHIELRAIECQRTIYIQNAEEINIHYLIYANWLLQNSIGYSSHSRSGN